MITETQMTLMRLLAVSLFGAPKPDLKNTDWKQLFEEAFQQTVFPLVISATEEEAKAALPPETFEEYDVQHQYYNSEAAKNDYYHGELHDILMENSIPYVIIKGQASAEYYPEPLERTVGDVDFLVRREDLEKAKKILKQKGFRHLPDPEHECHMVFSRDDEIIEMHWEPNGIPAGEKGDLCREYLADCISKAHPSSGEGSYMLPDPFHHGLIILLHTATHLTNTGIGLRHLCDWAVFVKHFDENTFTGIFEEKLKNIGLWQFARFLTAVSTKYLGLPGQSWARDAAEEEYLEKLMEDFLSGGNFGSKDPDRINDAKLIVNKGNMKGNMLMQLFAALSQKARLAMPACRHFPILLPVGWIYIIVRHLKRIRQGRRPQIHVRHMVQEASERREIYRRFELFK